MSTATPMEGIQQARVLALMFAGPVLGSGGLPVSSPLVSSNYNLWSFKSLRMMLTKGCFQALNGHLCQHSTAVGFNII